MVLIAVRGSASRFVPAERGTVRLVLQREDYDRAVAVQQTARLHEQYVADAKTFVHRGSAAWWGSDQVQVRAERRYVKDSAVYRTVQVAAAEVRVKFRDFVALSTWVERAGSAPGVTIGGIDWTVTEQHRVAVRREVRVQAVQDARQRAEAYASAIGGGELRLQSLWEPGLRPHATGGGEDGGFMTRAMSAAGSSSEFELRPHDIEITAQVTADFVVEPA